MKPWRLIIPAWVGLSGMLVVIGLAIGQLSEDRVRDVKTHDDRALPAADPLLRFSASLEPVGGSARPVRGALYAPVAGPGPESRTGAATLTVHNTGREPLVLDAVRAQDAPGNALADLLAAPVALRPMATIAFSGPPGTFKFVVEWSAETDRGPPLVETRPGSKGVPGGASVSRAVPIAPAASSR